MLSRIHFFTAFLNFVLRFSVLTSIGKLLKDWIALQVKLEVVNDRFAPEKTECLSFP